MNPFCSCSLETESTVRYQNYTTSGRVPMTDLKNINDTIMPLNENDPLHIILYVNKFDNKANMSILTVTIIFINVCERFDQLFFNYYQNHSYFFIHNLFKTLIKNSIFHLIFYKWSVKYRFCAVSYYTFTFIWF